MMSAMQPAGYSGNPNYAPMFGGGFGGGGMGMGSGGGMMSMLGTPGLQTAFNTLPNYMQVSSALATPLAYQGMGLAGRQLDQGHQQTMTALNNQNQQFGLGQRTGQNIAGMYSPNNWLGQGGLGGIFENLFGGGGLSSLFGGGDRGGGIMSSFGGF